MIPLLIVTGARELAKTPETKTWAIGILRDVISALPHDAIVGHGASPQECPDWWARDLANEFNLRSIGWRAEGIVEDSHGPKLEWRKDGVVHTPTREHFLERNARMIDRAAAWLAANKGPVAVLGLRHARSRTHGTDYTLRMARAAMLWTREETWT